MSVAKQHQNMSVLEVRLGKHCWNWAGSGSALFICARPGSQAPSLSRFTFFPCLLPRQAGVRQGEGGIACEVTQIESRAFLKEQRLYKYIHIFFASHIFSFGSLKVK